MNEELDAVRKSAEKLRRAEKRRDDVAEERDNAVRAALEAGVSVVELTRATGLNRSRMYQIRDFRR